MPIPKKVVCRAVINNRKVMACLVCLAVLVFEPANFTPSKILAADPVPNFGTLLKQETRSTIGKVADYIKANPNAPDVAQAWRWLFKTALEQRMENDAIPFAELYLKSDKRDPLLQAMAQQTLMFGFARAGKGDDAIDLFQSQLRFARLQNGREFVDFSLQLATALRVAGQFDASKKVLDETANKFFLDGEIRAICENKAAKLALIDKDAPVVDSVDTKGHPLSLSEFKGKVVIIDFWATNCAPCIEEFPNLKDLYADLHDKGLEIVGVSLDGDAALVDAFSIRFQLPWRMIVAENDVEQLRQRYFARKIPSLYIVARNGKVVQYDVRGADLRETLHTLIAQ